MKSASVFVFLCAALHVVGAVLGGVSGGLIGVIAPVVIYLALFAGLTRGILPVAWLAFFVTLVGVAWAMAGLLGSAPDPVLWGLLACNAVAALLLFGAIWAGPADDFSPGS